MTRIIIFIFVFSNSLTAQFNSDNFVLKTNRDTILAGNVLEITFTVENLDGKFQQPDLTDFIIVGGPNTSSSFSVINGKTESSASYSYGILLEEEGEIVIPRAQLITVESIYHTIVKQIVVLPNPEGIIERPPTSLGYSYPQSPNRPKAVNSSSKNRKLRKI